MLSKLVGIVGIGLIGFTVLGGGGTTEEQDTFQNVPIPTNLSAPFGRLVSAFNQLRQGFPSTGFSPSGTTIIQLAPPLDIGSIVQSIISSVSESVSVAPDFAEAQARRIETITSAPQRISMGSRSGTATVLKKLLPSFTTLKTTIENNTRIRTFSQSINGRSI